MKQGLSLATEKEKIEGDRRREAENQQRQKVLQIFSNMASAVATSMATIGLTWLAKEVVFALVFTLKFRKKVESLERDFKVLQEYLNHVEEEEDNLLDPWVHNVRDVASKLELIMETFAFAVASRRNILLSFHTLTDAWKIYQFGAKTVTAEVEKLKERRYLFNEPQRREATSTPMSEKQRQQRGKSRNLQCDNFVGFKEDIEELVAKLLDEDDRCRIISISGMGGVGKTTLAKKIYDNGKVRAHFDHFAWAYVSQICEERQIWQNILFSLTNSNDEEQNEIMNLNDEQMSARVKVLLREKRCLLVLDDIWDNSHWEALSDLFPTDKQETRSKIIFTCRNKEVAQHAKEATTRAIRRHELNCLSEELSWQLLRNIACSGRNIEDEKMEEEARGMIKHCAGLPLAITLLGGILASKHSAKKWEDVHKNINLYLRGDKKDYRGVKNVLMLSYKDLPYHVKMCFLHMSQFTNDCNISVNELIRMWIAEGFVRLYAHGRGEIQVDESLESIGWMIFDELLDRHMVSLVHGRGYLEVDDTFHMHDLMRDFCIAKARDVNFTEIVDRMGGRFVSSSSCGGVARRLALNLHGGECIIPLKCIKNHHLSSLMCLNDLNCRHWSVEKCFFQKLKLLKVLYLGGVDFSDGKVPDEVGELVLMKFLSMKGAGVTELPRSFGNLAYLESLDLDVSHPLYIPDVLCKMEQLRYLFLPIVCHYKTKLKLGNLLKLQKLFNFTPRHCDVNDLFGMTNLKELSIRHPSLIENLESFSSLLNDSLIDLRYLELVDNQRVDIREIVPNLGGVERLILNLKLVALPTFHQFPRALKTLKLSHCCLLGDPMEILEKIPSLESLVLDDGSFIGDKMKCSTSGFPRLVSLSLRCLWDLESWEVEDGAIPELVNLHVERCERMTGLPDELKNMKKLQPLDIKHMPNSFKQNLFTQSISTKPDM